MRDRRILTTLWRAAHAVGAAGLFALAAAVFASLPARAQAPSFDGVEPCLASHFDPNRYLAELGALGWQAVAEESRVAALAWLADAFAPLSEEGFDYATLGAEAAARIAAQREVWARMTEGRNVLVRDRQVLFIGGDQHADGRRRVSCWLAAPADDALLGRLFDIWAEAGLVVEGPTVSRGGIPEAALPDGSPGTLVVRGVRTRASAMPMLSAHEGLLIQVLLPAGGAP